MDRFEAPDDSEPGKKPCKDCRGSGIYVRMRTSPDPSGAMTTGINGKIVPAQIAQFASAFCPKCDGKGFVEKKEPIYFSESAPNAKGSMIVTDEIFEGSAT